MAHIRDSLSYSTVFHITHWKAGSQWIRKILTQIDAEKIVEPLLNEKQFLHDDLKSGFIYPSLYVTNEQFNSIDVPDDHEKFVVVRDLRDVLISAYFSIKFSHALMNEQLGIWRVALGNMTLEQGLLFLIDEWLHFPAEIQSSWVASGIKLYKYEDLLIDDVTVLTKIFIEDCKMEINRNRLERIIIENRFESLTGGRKAGVEDASSHERKGISGDWMNYFTPTIERKFLDRYGDLLIRADYC